MLDVDFETSDIQHVLKQTEDFLSESGYTETVLERAEEYLHIVAEDEDGEKRMIKVAWTPDGMRGLETDVEFSVFVGKQSKDDQPIRVPDGEFTSRGDVAFAVFDLISTNAFGEDAHPTATVKRLDKNHFEKIFQALLFLDGFKQNNLSMYFIGDSGRNSEQAISERFSTLVEGLVEHEALDEALGGKVETAWGDAALDRAFQHRDFAPWNMGLDDEKRFVLFDAEASGWGLRCYDIADFYVQTYVRGGEPETAKRFLNFVIDRFNEEKREFAIRKALIAPMLYRLLEAVGEHTIAEREEMVKLARGLIEDLLAQDIQALV
jgi:hypothetical protein